MAPGSWREVKPLSEPPVGNSPGVSPCKGITQPTRNSHGKFLLNGSLISCGSSRNCFAYRDPLVMHAHYRNYRSSRGPTLPLCPIPGRKGNSDVAGVASHGNGPFSQGRQVQHPDALDRLGRTQARHRRLAGQNLKTIRREYFDREPKPAATAAGRSR